MFRLEQGLSIIKHNHWSKYYSKKGKCVKYQGYCAKDREGEQELRRSRSVKTMGFHSVSWQQLTSAESLKFLY